MQAYAHDTRETTESEMRVAVQRWIGDVLQGAEADSHKGESAMLTGEQSLSLVNALKKISAHLATPGFTVDPVLYRLIFLYQKPHRDASVLASKTDVHPADTYTSDGTSTLFLCNFSRISFLCSILSSASGHTKVPFCSADTRRVLEQRLHPEPGGSKNG